MTSEQIKATISILVIFVVNIANLLGYALDANLLTNIFLTIAAFIAIGYGVWKNHNFTKAAGIAQNLLNDLKNKDDEDTETPYN